MEFKGKIYFKDLNLELNNAYLKFDDFTIQLDFDKKNNNTDVFNNIQDLNTYTFNLSNEKMNMYFKRCYIKNSITNSVHTKITLRTLEDIEIKYKNINNKKISEIETKIYNLNSNFTRSIIVELDDYIINMDKISSKDKKNIVKLNIVTKNNKKLYFSLENFVNFLSLITCNKVSYDDILFKNNKGEIVKKLKHEMKIPYSIEKIDYKNKNFHKRNPESIEESIKKYYLNYEKKTEDYPFHIIIGFYLDAFNQNYLEMKYLSLMTCLETIIRHFEKSNEDKFKKEWMKKNNKKLKKELEKCFKNWKNENSDISNNCLKRIKEYSKTIMPLEEKISCFIKDYNLDYERDIKNFIKIRNNITHKGLIKIDDNLNPIKGFNDIVELVILMISALLKENTTK